MCKLLKMSREDVDVEDFTSSDTVLPCSLCLQLGSRILMLSSSDQKDYEKKKGGRRRG